MGKKIFIVGGGPAGLTASIAALRHKAEVTLLEHKEKSGKKLLVTGRGRCNLTNQNLSTKMYFGNNTTFVRECLQTFGLKQTLKFLSSVGIKTFCEPSGKYFPFSEQASAVLECLRMELHALGGKEITSTEVRHIKKTGQTFSIETEDGTVFKADSVILATGGQSYPNLGSDGSGYALAKSLGHSLIPPRPALVQITTPDKTVKTLKGYKFIGKACLNNGKKNIDCFDGEILFTDYGFSGIPILQLSRHVAPLLNHKKQIFLSLDILPHLEIEQIQKEILSRWKDFPRRNLETSLVGFLHKKLIRPLLQQCKLLSSTSTQSLTTQDAMNIAKQLKNWIFPINGTLGWENAQITAGGINTREVHSVTLESKICPGLFFAGEILDVDGLSGGYNLQWAWTSGYLAGKAASGYIKEGARADRH